MAMTYDLLNGMGGRSETVSRSHYLGRTGDGISTRVKMSNLDYRANNGTAFQTAVSLAEYDAEKGEDGKVIVTDDHLRAVVELSRDFKTYLGELHRGDEAKRAERNYERLDSYTHS